MKIAELKTFVVGNPPPGPLATRADVEGFPQDYRELFAEEPRSRHKQSLFRHVAWRMQARAEGGLSERARQRAYSLADEADLRVLLPREALAPITVAPVRPITAGGKQCQRRAIVGQNGGD